ncbi:MAG TPA: gamma carbonic anhydrase family protein [Pseudonocardia sp.]
MPLFAFEGTAPTVDPSAWIAPTATLVGDVRVEAEASVWYGAVLRADFGPIIIRAGANIQDNSVLHGSEDPLVIGVGATVGHLCVVHNCIVGTEALIGNGAIVQDGARIGDRALVGAGALIPPNMVVPDDQMALGAPATLRPLTESAGWWVKTNTAVYRALAARHKTGATEA